MALAQVDSEPSMLLLVHSASVCHNNIEHSIYSFVCHDDIQQSTEILNKAPPSVLNGPQISRQRLQPNKLEIHQTATLIYW